jgi:hypothetical protein
VKAIETICSSSDWSLSSSANPKRRIELFRFTVIKSYGLAHDGLGVWSSFQASGKLFSVDPLRRIGFLKVVRG